MKVGIAGAGAFGTALAMAEAAEGRAITLWARDPERARQMRRTRQNPARLPGVSLPENVSVTAEIEALAACDILLLAVPMQQLSAFLAAAAPLLSGKALVACAKGIDLATGRGPTAIIAEHCPDALPAVLTGPSFAADIARFLPTALTLACADDARGAGLQAALATPSLRLYRTTDVTGAELGGALKNVIAIAAGIVAGAGLGDSARAALITRGFAEMNRLAGRLGARPETLSGLSGLGDLVLTCSSLQSRNYRFGHALGAAEAFDPAITVEGAATARAAADLARRLGLEMPITEMVARLVAREITVEKAVAALLARPLREE